MPLHTRLMLVKSLAIPLFTYCDVVYTTNLDSKSKGIIDKAFAACVRFVYRIKRFDSTRDYLNRILGCGLAKYHEYRQLVFMHGILQTNPKLFV